ncbi:unnamed protein product [Ectocarpus sp. 4 AP-2014]
MEIRCQRQTIRGATRTYPESSGKGGGGVTRFEISRKHAHFSSLNRVLFGARRVLVYFPFPQAKMFLMGTHALTTHPHLQLQPRGVDPDGVHVRSLRQSYRH